MWQNLSPKPYLGRSPRYRSRSVLLNRSTPTPFPITTGILNTLSDYGNTIFSFGNVIPKMQGFIRDMENNE